MIGLKEGMIQQQTKWEPKLNPRRRFHKKTKPPKANEAELKTVKSAYEQLLSQSAHITLSLAKYQIYEKGEYSQQYVHTFSKGKLNILPNTRN